MSDERIVIISAETEAKIESSIKDKPYYQLMSDYQANGQALEHCNEQVEILRQRREILLAQKSILMARGQALRDELNKREWP